MHLLNKKPVLQVLPTITTSAKHYVEGSEILLQNKGTTTILLDNGWTMDPGSLLTFGSILCAPNKHTLQIKFEGVGVNKLEILVQSLVDIPNCENPC